MLNLYYLYFQPLVNKTYTLHMIITENMNGMQDAGPVLYGTPAVSLVFAVWLYAE